MLLAFRCVFFLFPSMSHTPFTVEGRIYASKLVTVGTARTTVAEWVFEAAHAGWHDFETCASDAAIDTARQLRLVFFYFFFFFFFFFLLFISTS